MKRFFACLLATIGLAGAVALVGSTPAGAGAPVTPYDCVLSSGLTSFDDVAIPTAVSDRRDPVPPGGTATYDVDLNLPEIGALPIEGLTVQVLQLRVEVPIPDGVTNVDVSFANPPGQTANPPLARWSDQSDADVLVAQFDRISSGVGEIVINSDGSYTWTPPGGQAAPVVAPAVSFTATMPNEANTQVQWTVPTIRAQMRTLGADTLTCDPQAPSTVMVTTSTCDTEDFTDVSPTHPFYCDIAWMNATGISTGFQPGPTYKPGTAVSRAAMSAFMYRLAGQPAFSAPADATFRDVSTGHPFFREIEWMADAGITTGTPGSPKPSYNPGAAVSRGAMAAFMYRFAGEPAFTPPGQTTFGDVTSGHPFFPEIEWMADAGISTGTAASPKPLYKPADAVSRQAMSAFMHRLDVLLGDPL